MARPKSTLTSADLEFATDYITNAMERGELSKSAGYTSFKKAKTPESLQAWCDDYLTPDQWDKMKTAIRVQRKRVKDFRTLKQKISVDLDKEAWQMLSSMAKEEGRTLSEMIKAYDDVYGKAKSMGIKPHR